MVAEERTDRVILLEGIETGKSRHEIRHMQRLSLPKVVSNSNQKHMSSFREVLEDRTRDHAIPSAYFYVEHLHLL